MRLVLHWIIRNSSGVSLDFRHRGAVTFLVTRGGRRPATDTNTITNSAT